MQIAVTDANIFIDLCYLRWEHRLLELGLEIHTTNFVLDELNTEQAAALISILGPNLTVYSLVEPDIAEMLKGSYSRALSDADKSVLWYVQTLTGTPIVLSGDKPIRVWCEDHGIEIHGILWLFDQLVLQNLLRPADALETLIRLLKFNPRLPVAECEKRLKEWEVESDKT